MASVDTKKKEEPISWADLDDDDFFEDQDLEASFGPLPSSPEPTPPSPPPERVSEWKQEETTPSRPRSPFMRSPRGSWTSGNPPRTWCTTTPSPSCPRRGGKGQRGRESTPLTAMSGYSTPGKGGTPFGQWQRRPASEPRPVELFPDSPVHTPLPRGVPPPGMSPQTPGVTPVGQRGARAVRPSVPIQVLKAQAHQRIVEALSKAIHQRLDLQELTKELEWKRWYSRGLGSLHTYIKRECKDLAVYHQKGMIFLKSENTIPSPPPELEMEDRPRTPSTRSHSSGSGREDGHSSDDARQGHPSAKTFSPFTPGHDSTPVATETRLRTEHSVEDIASSLLAMSFDIDGL